MTLAIGDGANDVSMIQAAHVGIGISGFEGRQAVMASDYAIGQFKFLRDLLLVHGHWSYYRLSAFILYFLYKNAVFVAILFVYQFYAAYSNQTPITDIDLIVFTFIYTLFPIAVHALFDQDLDRKRLLQYPQLYEIGQRGELYTQFKFWVIVMDLFYQASAITLIPLYIYSEKDVGIYNLGVPITAIGVLVINFHLFLDTHYWTYLNHWFYWISIASYYILSFMFQSDPTASYYHAIFDEM